MSSLRSSSRAPTSTLPHWGSDCRAKFRTRSTIRSICSIFSPRSRASLRRGSSLPNCRSREWYTIFMTVRGLRISWATSAASSPRAEYFSLRRSCSSIPRIRSWSRAFSMAPLEAAAKADRMRISSSEKLCRLRV